MNELIYLFFKSSTSKHCAPMDLDRWCTCVRCRFHMQVKPNHKYKVGNDIKKYFDEHFLSYGAFFFRAK